MLFSLLKTIKKIFYYYYLQDSSHHLIFHPYKSNSLVFRSLLNFFPTKENTGSDNHSKEIFTFKRGKIPKKSYNFDGFVFLLRLQIMKNIIIFLLFIHSKHPFSSVNRLKNSNLKNYQQQTKKNLQVLKFSSDFCSKSFQIIHLKDFFFFFNFYSCYFFVSNLNFDANQTFKNFKSSKSKTKKSNSNGIKTIFIAYPNQPRLSQASENQLFLRNFTLLL